MAAKSSGQYKCTLSAELLKKAQDELHENPQTRHLEIKTFRERVESFPGLKSRTDDNFLLRFLRAKKFDQERAFAQLLTYHKMRKDNPDVYQNLTPQRVRLVLEAGVATVLKDRALDGSRVLIFRPGLWDPDRSPLNDVLANNFLTLSKLIEEEETQVCGITMVGDLTGLGWNQAKHISPLYAKRVSSLLQEAFPARFKGLHFLHEPTFFDVVFAILKQFMKEKILSRIRLHGEKMETLHQFVPPDILPEDYGGKLPKLSAKDWIDTMLASEAQFVEDNKYGMLDMTVESKSSKKQDATESLGGTFRKLDVN